MNSTLKAQIIGLSSFQAKTVTEALILICKCGTSVSAKIGSRSMRGNCWKVVTVGLGFTNNGIRAGRVSEIYIVSDK